MAALTCEVDRPLPGIVRYIYSNAFTSHDVLVATTPDDKRYIIDLTGGQFDWTDRFCEEGAYIAAQLRESYFIMNLQEYAAASHTGRPLLPPNAPIRVASMIRTEAAKSMTAKMADWMASQWPPAVTMRDIFVLPAPAFERARAAIIRQATAGVHEGIGDFTDRGIGRLYYDTESDGLAAVSTEAEAEKYKQLWFSQEEYRPWPVTSSV